MKKCILTVITLLIFTILAACSSNEDDRTFAEARSSFETQLTRQVTNQHPIPTPPEGVFDLVHFPSTVGDLAAFVSSDPQDGQRHPLIIWVVGGWSNGISDIPWSYPNWDNDQTGSAFREAGMLMMYPSFRGANGNPGYHETLFGEIDDIVAAFEFARSLPYVDPDRIYLGGHSTGATRVLLAAAYTDVFRAVLSFGPVGDIRQHNQAQFTFDVRNADERRMRSPIYWLNDISTPTFIIEGAQGNASEVRNIESESAGNDNIHCFIVEGADHFNILAPATRLLAQKLMNDTGSESNISLTLQELQNAMNQPPVSPMPAMTYFYDEIFELGVLIPAIWGWDLFEEENGFIFYSNDFGENNFWDTSVMVMELFSADEKLSFDEFSMAFFGEIMEGIETTINGNPAFIIEFFDEADFNVAAAFQREGEIAIFTLWLPQRFTDFGKELFNTIIDSVELF